MRLVRSIATTAAVAAVMMLVMTLVSIPADGQGRGRGGGGGGNNAPNPAVVHNPVPRTPDGKPDLSGTWQSGGVSITGEDGAPPLKPLPPIDNHPIRREPLAYTVDFDQLRKTKNFRALDGAVFRTPFDVRVEECECIENNPDPEHMKKALELEKSKK
jgi:hypothetical protein